VIADIDNLALPAFLDNIFPLQALKINQVLAAA
jgi:hypothetical protein